MKKNYLILECKNIFGNFIGLFFSFIFPSLLANIIIFSNKADIPEQFMGEFKTSVFLLLACVIPLSLAFVGFPALFSQETEKGITRRFILFGYKMKDQLLHKLVANLIVILLAVITYFVSTGWMNGVNIPSYYSMFLFTTGMLVISIDFFLIAFAITWFLKTFSRVYGVTMTLYFAVMILTGMFGVKPEKFGKIVETIANLIPITKFNSVLSENWTESTYSLGTYPYVLLGFTVFSVLLVVYANKVNRI